MLEIKDLNVFYGAIHALKGISLTVGDGELVSLIGANGAGKTTTLHTPSPVCCRRPPGPSRWTVPIFRRSPPTPSSVWASLLIQSLRDLEQQELLAPDAGILVAPCANQFSMNVGRRFWAADNTDINRMFPGYDQGETTQRIAARVFNALQGYTYGVQLTSFYLAGDHLSHIRIMSTGYVQAEEGLAFGLPYVMVRKPQPYDTTTLNYNWQIWNTKAFSLYTPETENIHPAAARQAVQAMLRFLSVKGLCRLDIPPAGDAPEVFRESCLHNILSGHGGLLLRNRAPGDLVKSGQILADILDPCSGQLLEHLRSDCTGRVFFARKSRLTDGPEVAFRILPEAPAPAKQRGHGRCGACFPAASVLW